MQLLLVLKDVLNTCGRAKPKRTSDRETIGNLAFFITYLELTACITDLSDDFAMKFL